MKKFLHSILIIISSLEVFSQAPITITGADLPQAGDNFIVANDTTPNILLGSPGSSPQSWDFTVVGNHYYKAAVYDSTSNTPYAAEFPASNISTFGPAEFFGALFGGAPVGAGYDGYMFWSSDSSGLKIIGWQAIDGPYAGMPIHTNPTELLIGTPATLGSSFNDVSRWDMTLNENPTDYDTTWVASRTKTLVADAWGSMTTPFGSFADILRIHETVVEVDSAIATFGGFPVTALEVFRDTLNNYMYMANGIGYPLAIVHADKNNVVKDIEYLIDTTCSVYTEIFGIIKNQAGGPITSGNAYLYQYIDSMTPMALVETTSIDSNNGGYLFVNVEAGYYLISAEANISLCPTCIPTYFGDANYWDSGEWLLTLCTANINADINISQVTPMSGNGSCSGKIQMGLGKKVGDPVPGLDVSIEQVPGGIKAGTTTDPNGNYSFTSMDTGTYKVVVDMPGLYMDSTYQIKITSTNTTFSNLDFTVDTTSGSAGIFVGYPLSAKELVVENSGLSFFPNPANEKISLLSKSELNNATLKISDLMGKSIIIVEDINERSISINTSEIPAGFYLWTLSDNNKLHGTGKISIIK